MTHTVMQWNFKLSSRFRNQKMFLLSTLICCSWQQTNFHMWRQLWACSSISLFLKRRSSNNTRTVNRADMRCHSLFAIVPSCSSPLLSSSMYCSENCSEVVPSQPRICQLVYALLEVKSRQIKALLNYCQSTTLLGGKLLQKLLVPIESVQFENVATAELFIQILIALQQEAENAKCKMYLSKLLNVFV